jgi:trans-2,3-dihydro-3-hydroxyanthranilate isomerase
MKFSYYIVDVFSPTPFGGNQLAVLPDAKGLTAEGMQRIAREFNFAETTFVLPPDDPRNSCKVRIFTPKAEVPFAGHPTVGTACALVLGGHQGGGASCDLVLEEGVGPVGVKVERKADLITGMLTLQGKIEQPAERPDPKALAAALSVAPNDVVNGFYASVGLPFCFTHLSSKEAVDRAAIDKGAWTQHFANAFSPNIFFFAGDAKSGGEIYARMFAPALGVEEDPATGSACATLAGVVASASSFTGEHCAFDVVQGVAMGRRSEIHAVAEKRDGRVVSVGVGGATAYVASGDISVPDVFLEKTFRK